MFSEIPLLPKLPRMYRRWQADDGPLMAAAVAYYAALSFFPLLLVLISGLGLVTQHTPWGRDAESQVLRAIEEYTSPSVRENVATMLEGVQRNAAVGGPLGVLALVFTAAALFTHFETAFDRIWNIESSETKGILRATRNALFTRVRAFLMLLGIGFLILTVFVSGMALSSLQVWSARLLPASGLLSRVLEIAASLGLNCVAFTLLYRLLPKVQVRWREAFRGALLAAAMWEAGRFVLTIVVIDDKYGAYGVVGSFIAIMLWIYIASSIVFLAAEYIQVICEDCNPHDTGPHI